MDAGARRRRQGEHRQTIDDDVLKRQPHRRSARPPCEPADGGRSPSQGELTLVGKTAPIAFDVAIGDDGMLSGSAVVTQSDWGIKPYSALFGALKVADEVETVAYRRRSCRRAWISRL